MSTQRSLADYGADATQGDPSVTETGGQLEQPASAPDDDADNERDLAAIFEDVAGTTTVTEPQEETPSHSPVEGDANEVPDLTDDGLDDAAATDYNGGLW